MTGKIDRNKLEDQTFGNWHVEAYTGYGKYLCKCSCGSTKTIEAHKLKGGYTKSCGCAPRKTPTTQGPKPKFKAPEKFE